MLETQPSAALELDFDLIDTVEGWMSKEESLLLGRLAMGVPNDQVILEVGNYRGRSTSALALGARRGSEAPIYSIDPHVDFTGPRGGSFGREDMAELYRNLTRLGLGARVHLVCLPSTWVARAWQGSPVGLLFIDGDHRYPAVRADFEGWLPHLAAGAQVVFDDCDYPDVGRLVSEAVASGQLEPKGSVGKLGWFQRR